MGKERSINLVADTDNGQGHSEMTATRTDAKDCWMDRMHTSREGAK